MYKLKELYESEIRAKLQKKYNYQNPTQVPKLKAIVLNMGVGREAVSNSKFITYASEQLALIAGQKPVVTLARKSNAAFKLREGMPIGCKVTLRNENMYNFLERLVYIALPRVRDFRGFSGKSFDGKGNLSIGVKEHVIFPEIEFDKIEKIIGMNIIFITSANTNAEGKELLSSFYVPFYD